MNNALHSRPNRYTAGTEFNYSLWTPGTTLTLVNVPWNNDYRDILQFDTSTGLDEWIDDQPNTLAENVSVQKLNQPVSLPLSIDDASKFNYLRAEHDGAKSYYYFITNVEYVNPGVTRLTLQLDVWSTYGQAVTFGSCFVERGHIGIANTNAWDNFGRDYLAEPEGFDIGAEYRIARTHTEKIMQPDDSSGYSVLVCSTADLTVKPEDVGSDTVPILVPSTGTTFQNMPSGASFYIFKNGGDFHAFLNAYADYPWVTQGIISITMIPNITRYYSGFDWADEKAGTDLPATFYKAPSDYPDSKFTACLNDWRDDAGIKAALGKYSILRKFFTAPYMVIELTTWTGSPLVIKPESWQDRHASVREMAALVPPGQRIAIMPYRYNADGVTEQSVFEGPWIGDDDHAEFLDFAAVISGFPTLPIVNNQAIEYLASNRNALAFAFRSADWSQNRAMTANQVGYGQASAGMNLMGQLNNIGINQANALTGIQNNLAIQQAITGGVAGIASGAVGGSMMGPAGAAGGAAVGAVGAIAGGFAAGNQIEAANQSTATRNSGAMQSTAAQVGTASYMRDTNKNLADFAAQGDYANTVAGIHAKIQDAALTQPSTSGQFGGDSFNLINNIFGFSLRWKIPSPKAVRAIGDYWFRYGYSVRQFVMMPTSLVVMSKFSYWKLSETYISQGPFPESFKQIIRGIFEKGVTVWRDPSDIGVTDWSDNTPIAGISY